VGSSKLGKRQDLAAVFYRKNGVCDGEWVNDLSCGRCFERYFNGNKYEGDFDNGKAHDKSD
jgi:hypothetical protein